VRSARGAFALAISPLALRRFARDAALKLTVPDSPADMHCLAGSKLVIERGGKKGVVLEEYRFNVSGDFPVDWENALSQLLTDAVLGGFNGACLIATTML
jgi:hypothetical protein